MWFLGCLERSLQSSEAHISHILFRAEFWQRHSHKILNERQQKVVNRMLDKEFLGNLNSSKYARLAKCSTDTALRDIKHLLAHGVLVANAAGGRSRSYRLAGKDG